MKIVDCDPVESPFIETSGKEDLFPGKIAQLKIHCASGTRTLFSTFAHKKSFLVNLCHPEINIKQTIIFSTFLPCEKPAGPFPDGFAFQFNKSEFSKTAAHLIEITFQYPGKHQFAIRLDP